MVSIKMESQLGSDLFQWFGVLSCHGHGGREPSLDPSPTPTSKFLSSSNNLDFVFDNSDTYEVHEEDISSDEPIYLARCI